MKTPLLEKLLDFYQEDPSDPFNAYALALEYEKTDSVTARHWYDTLLTKFPDYLPTYYQAAQFFIQEEENEKAETVLKTGIGLAKMQHSAKTEQELIRALKAHEDEQSDW